ncbi:MAG: phospholipid carrier-dependent glycosyltransferase [Anaerolineae bacterium]|nr:phospholipid carrier-dependent glycosyltransferase [Anaerolineae bacterium]
MKLNTPDALRPTPQSEAPPWDVSRLTPHASTPQVLQLALFLFLFSIYLLSYTPRINSSDGLAMFATAESIIRRGALDIEQIRWMELQQGTFGLDGLLYSRKGIGVPIGLLPLTWLGLVVPWWGTVGVSLLFNATVTALTAVLLSAYLQELGFTRRTGLTAALTFGLTTLAWPYAKSLFSDPFSGFLLLAAAYALLKYSRGAEEQGSRGEKNLSPALLYPFLAGLCLGWNVATRYAEALFVPMFGLLLLYYLFRALRTMHYAPRTTHHAFLPILAFCVPLVFTALGLIFFNLSRYGDPFNTGYLPSETFSGILWQGLAGQLLSPGRGLFLYCPIFLLSLAGFWPFFRRHRAEAVTALSVILIHLFLYGKWFMWHGGYSWGPRFMVPTLPFWALFLAPVVAQAFNKILNFQPSSLPASILRVLFLALAVLGLIPQLLSVAIDFSPFQNSLLDAGLPLFDPQTFFDPRYSPFIGAWKFINLESLDLAWAWQGQVNGWLLLVLVFNMILAAFNLRESVVAESLCVANSAEKIGCGLDGSGGFKAFFKQTIPLICILSTLGATTFLLVHTHTLPAQPLTQAVGALNEGVRPADAVITNDPEIAMPFAELYKGRAPVLGLQSGGFPLPGEVTRRLNETMAAHRQVWWLPSGIPPEESAVEQTLMRAGFRARSDDFAGQRLVLFAFPANLAANMILLKAEFEQPITLLAAAYPPQTRGGAVMPVELHWQSQAALSENYHVFIHLVGQDGQLAAQADGQPVVWTRPTTTWAVGETIVDRYGLWLPAQTAPGQYQLRVGLYRPTDGRRLRLTTGEEWVKFTVLIE